MFEIVYLDYAQNSDDSVRYQAIKHEPSIVIKMSLETAQRLRDSFAYPDPPMCCDVCDDDYDATMEAQEELQAALESITAITES